MNVDAALIPTGLRQLDQWVVWRYEQRNGKATKVPCRADDEGNASSTDPATWSSFDSALAAAEWLDFDGVGFVFAPDDSFCGVDLDDCVGRNGWLLHPAAGAILAMLDSYAEVSPGQQGVKAIVRAGLNGFPRNRTSHTGWGGEFEVYEQGRFFTVTGLRLVGCPETVEPRQQQLDEVLRLVFGDLTNRDTDPRLGEVVSFPVGLDDGELLWRALTARNGEEVERLWSGDWSAYPSRSEADAALCRHLGYWCGGDAARVDRLFRRSGLMRPKWQRPDYRERTLSFSLGSGV